MHHACLNFYYTRRAREIHKNFGKQLLAVVSTK